MPGEVRVVMTWCVSAGHTAEGRPVFICVSPSSTLVTTPSNLYLAMRWREAFGTSALRST